MQANQRSGNLTFRALTSQVLAGKRRMTSPATLNLFWGAISRQAAVFGLRRAGVLGAIALTGSLMAFTKGKKDGSISGRKASDDIQKESVSSQATHES